MVILGLIMTAATARSLLFVQGPSTPKDLTALTTSSIELLGLSDFHVLHAKFEEFRQLEELLPSVLGVIDLTFSQVERNVLGSLCAESLVPHIVLGYAETKSTPGWSYYVTGRKSDLAAALDAVVSYFNWTKLNVATDENIHLGGISNVLEQNTDRTYEQQNFMLHSLEQVESKVGKGMRLSGNRVSVILTDPETTEKILISQYHMSIGGEGFANLLPLYSSLYSVDEQIPTMNTGNLVLAESGLEEVSTVTELYAQWLSSAVS